RSQRVQHVGEILLVRVNSVGLPHRVALHVELEHALRPGNAGGRTAACACERRQLFAYRTRSAPAKKKTKIRVSSGGAGATKPKNRPSSALLPAAAPGCALFWREGTASSAS